MTFHSRNPQIRVLAPSEGERLNVLGAPILIKRDGTNGLALLAEQPLPAGYHVPLHFHDDEDEFFFVLEGEVTFEGEQGLVHAGPGTFVDCPRGSRHGFRNETAAPARMLVMASAGGGLAPMFREFDKTTQTGAALSPDRLAAIAAQNGIHML